MLCFVEWIECFTFGLQRRSHRHCARTSEEGSNCGSSNKGKSRTQEVEKGQEVVKVRNRKLKKKIGQEVVKVGNRKWYKEETESGIMTENWYLMTES
jgi:hypothetical protein